MIGTTAALIAMGISAAGSVAGAKIASNAAKDAAATQVAGADKASAATSDIYKNILDFSKQQWQQQQQNQEPWLAYGRGALGTLGGLMGIKPVSTPGMENALSGMPGGGSTTMGGLYGGAGIGPGKAVTSPGKAIAVADGSGGSGAAPQRPQFVRVAWPDGTTSDVPSKDVAQYESLGAKVA